ncbi:MAG: GNAT family N-acetyltransferase [Deltaproteobacteria bacterium]|jgi:ribosomal protein S18 acetylase RimI-like enzyme|nr:GNAT family N-acetyltransferase [Deltaproteobacteria bacterium]
MSESEHMDDGGIAAVRPATPDDGPSILRMMEAFNVYEGIPWTRAGLEKSFATLLAHPEWGGIFFAEVGGIPAGYAVYAYSFDFEFAGRDAFLCELFVTERHRQKRIGQTLLATVEAHVRANDVRAVHLIVRGENATAQVLYRRNGFRFDPRLLMTKALE